jgi:hypothetical protein
MNPRAPSGEDDPPGVPGFRTWRSVYIFVFIFFVVCVALLALLSRAFA